MQIGDVVTFINDTGKEMNALITDISNNNTCSLVYVDPECPYTSCGLEHALNVIYAVGVCPETKENRRFCYRMK